MRESELFHSIQEKAEKIMTRYKRWFIYLSFVWLVVWLSATVSAVDLILLALNQPSSLGILGGLLGLCGIILIWDGGIRFWLYVAEKAKKKETL